MAGSDKSELVRWFAKDRSRGIFSFRVRTRGLEVRKKEPLVPDE